MSFFNYSTLAIWILLVSNFHVVSLCCRLSAPHPPPHPFFFLSSLAVIPFCGSSFIWCFSCRRLLLWSCSSYFVLIFWWSFICRTLSFTLHRCKHRLFLTLLSVILLSFSLPDFFFFFCCRLIFFLLVKGPFFYLSFCSFLVVFLLNCRFIWYPMFFCS